MLVHRARQRRDPVDHEVPHPQRERPVALERRLQVRVAGRAPREPVDALVEAQEHLGVRVRRRVQLGREQQTLLAQLVRHPLGGQPRGMRLERRADLVEPRDVLGVDIGHQRAAARAHLDEMLEREPLDGLAQRRAPDAELAHELVLAQRGARRQPQVDDPIAQTEVRAIGELLGRRGHRPDVSLLRASRAQTPPPRPADRSAPQGRPRRSRRRTRARDRGDRPSSRWTRSPTRCSSPATSPTTGTRARTHACASCSRRSPSRCIPSPATTTTATRCARRSPTIPVSRRPTGFVQYEVDCGGVRVLMCDTLVPGTPGGSFDAERRAWLAAALDGSPTIVAMHHPPIPTGIAEFDTIGLPCRRHRRARGAARRPRRGAARRGRPHPPRHHGGRGRRAGVRRAERMAAGGARPRAGRTGRRRRGRAARLRPAPADRRRERSSRTPPSSATTVSSRGSGCSSTTRPRSSSTAPARRSGATGARWRRSTPSTSARTPCARRSRAAPASCPTTSSSATSCRPRTARTPRARRRSGAASRGRRRARRSTTSASRA